MTGASTKSLYERLGGYDAICAVANNLLPRIISVSECENAEAFGKARVKRSEDEAFKKWFSDLTSSG